MTTPTATGCPAVAHYGEAPDYDRDDPFPLYADLQAAGPVHDVTLADGHRAFLVVGYAAAREALNHPDLSKDMHAALARDGAVVAEGLPGPDYARHMLSVDGPDHTRLRGLASAAFTRRRVEALAPRIREIATELLDELDAAATGGPEDLVAGYAAPLPFAVLGELLGLPRGDQRRLSGWFATLLAPYPGGEPPAAAREASDRVTGFLTDLVEERWDAPTPDLVGDLVVACRDGRLDQAELRSTLFQLVVAGHDTTTALIGNGVAALLAHPEQLGTLVRDPSRVPQAVEELLRWDAPVHHSTLRWATRDVTVAGTLVPAGVQVIVSLAAAGRDPARNEDAGSLHLGRPGAHLAFGHGVHHCLGARLPRLEGDIALTALLTRFPGLRLAVPADRLQWQHGDGLVLRGLSELPVLLREPSPLETDA